MMLKKRVHQISKVLLSVLMIVMLMVNSSAVFADDVKESADMSGFLTDAGIVSYKEVPYTKETKIPKHAEDVQFEITFTEKNDHQFSIGKILEYTLPEGLILPNEQKGDVLMGGTAIGTYKIKTDGKVQMELKAAYDSDDIVITNCRIGFTANLGDIASDSANPKMGQIAFPPDKTVTFLWEDPINFSLNKSVQSYDKQTHIVTYQIDLAITEMNMYSDGTTITLTDTMGKNLTYQANSLSIDGVKQSDPEIKNQQFILEIPIAAGQKGSETITVIYQAKVKDSAFMQANTNAVVVNEVDNRVTAEEINSKPQTSEVDLATDSGTKDEMKYQWIEKSGKRLTDDAIEWTVKMNSSCYFAVGGYTFKDVLDSRGILTYDTIQGVTLKKTNSNGDVVYNGPVSVNYNDKNTQFTYLLPAEDTTPYIYEFTYTTLYNSKGFIGSGVYYNDAYLTGSGQNFHSQVGIALKGVEATAKKEVTAYDFDTTEWNYTIHVPQEGLDHAYFVDTFGNNDGIIQSLPSDITDIHVSSTGSVNFYYTVRLGENGFKIYFADTQDKADAASNEDKNGKESSSFLPGTSVSEGYDITITYQTKITNMSESMIGKTVKNTGKLYAEETSVQASAARKIIAAVNKSGNANKDGTITWNIIVPKSFLNAAVKEDNKIVLHDEMLADELQYINGSVTMKALDGILTNPSVVDFNTVISNTAISAIDEGNGKIKFLIDIVSDVHDYYLITYKTKIVDERLLDEQSQADHTLQYENKVAIPYSGMLDDFQFNSSAIVPYDNKIINKQVTEKPIAKNKNTVTYQIDINPLGLDLYASDTYQEKDDYFVYDMPSDNLSLKYDTIQIQDKTANTTLTTTDYRVFQQVVNGESQIVFQIHNKKIAGEGNGHHYVITYQAKVLGNVGENTTYSNSASLNNLSDIRFEQSYSYKYESSYSSAEILNYELTIKKSASDDMLGGLAGAEYTVYKENYDPLNQNRYLMETLVTDEYGCAKLEKLLSRYDCQAGTKLILVETKAPEGYTLNNQPIEIILNDGKQTIENNERLADLGSTLYLSDEKTENELIIQKQFYKGNELQNEDTLSAVFGLYENPETTVPLLEATSFLGNAKFHNLADGTYYLKERATAEGYQLSKTIHEVKVTGTSIKIDGQLTNTVLLKNQYCFGSFSFTKQDVLKERNLKGAIFSLSNKQKRYEAVSDDLGEVHFTDLEQGTYLLLEEQAPSRYERSDAMIQITVDQQGNVLIGDQPWTADSLTALFLNTLIEGEQADTAISLVITDSSNTPLNGAVFTLYKRINGSLVEIMELSGQSEYKIEHLDEGDYVLKQTLTPEGYLAVEDYLFTIDEQLRVWSSDQEVVDNRIPMIHTQYIDAEELQPVLPKPIQPHPVLPKPIEPNPGLPKPDAVPETPDQKQEETKPIPEANKTEIAQTGDQSNPWINIGCMAISGGLFAAIIKLSKRKHPLQ